ncbi:MAG: STAS domain-containing protein [Bacteroidetes bacterium]|nr:STAS domain-containing protein [Bacteroidota bacterium]
MPTNMNFSLEKTEHYSLLKTSLTALDQPQAEEITRMVKAHLAGIINPYLILNFDSVESCNAGAVRELINLGLHLHNQDGMLIISNPHPQFARLFDKAEIVFVPTDIEAIDYVFMDQLEKQFLQGGDDEE